MGNKLFSAVQAANLNIQKAAEIGVLTFESSAIKDFIVNGIKCDLYEAIPEFCDDISKKVSPYSNTVLHRTAVSDYQGSMKLCMAGPSTFNAAQRASPAINHDGFDKTTAKTVSVPCADFEQIDPGNYDLISIDVEGGEFAILSRMKSRPLVIALETQSRDYCNPKLGSITDWMVENGYSVWIWNDTDTIFFKGIPPQVGVSERLKAKWHSFRYFASRI